VTSSITVLQGLLWEK